MSRAAQGEHGRVVVGAPGEWGGVVILELAWICTGAAPARAVVYEGAPFAVALDDGALDRGRHVARARRSVGLGQALARLVSLAEAPALELGKEHRDRLAYDLPQIGLGLGVAHERLGPVQLVAEL
jgi:hypothetical protein